MKRQRPTQPISQAMRDYWQEIREMHAAQSQDAPETETEAELDYCPYCASLGMVHYNVPIDHPDFGKWFPCPANCKTAQKNTAARLEKLVIGAGIPAAYENYTFDTWKAKVGFHDTEKKEAVRAAHEFAHHPQHFVSDTDGGNLRHSLVLHGNVGTGKTGLMVAIARVLMERGVPVLYTRCDDLIESVQEAYKGKGRSAAQVLAHIKSFDVLLLDEFNLDEFQTERTSRDKRRIIESIIRYRYSNGLPMVATCNVSPAEFRSEWGERITDPLQAMAHWVYLGGANLRNGRLDIKSRNGQREKERG